MDDVARLSDRDLALLLDVVGEASAADGAQPFELDVLKLLVDLVPADRAGYYEFTRARPGNLYETDTDHLDTFDWSAKENCEAIFAWPLLDSHRGCPERALKLSDFLTPRELERNRWYLDAMRPWGCRYEMKLWLPSPAGFVRGFFFTRRRDRRDFDERDRSVLTLLRPHLARIRERWELRHRPGALTDREVEVLALVREGFTNREIAERLVISRTTVRTHLENVFEKFGVHTRTAAVARAYGGSPAP